MKKILVVGQTPPPYGGQALMTKRLVDARFESAEIIHVRMSFSESFLEIGRASWKKVGHVFSIAFQIWKHRLKNRKLVLYYMPAGPNKVPVLRDLMLLILVRPFFSKTIYHFRAAGVSEFIGNQSYLFKILSLLIYGKPSVGIQLSSLNPADAAFFSAKKIYYIPNGLEDCFTVSQKINVKKEIIELLFVGVLREDKGFSWLLRALSILKQRGKTNFRLYAMGEFSSKKYETEVRQYITDNSLEEHILFLGVKVGEDKWRYYSQADILCFPSFFDCESFGNVLVEGMMFQMPLISSRWRGIPDIVTDDVGFLVDVNDDLQLAEKILRLLEDEELRIAMGHNSRARYLEKYTLPHYLSQMEIVFNDIQ